MLLETNLQQNLQLVVQVAKEYTEQLTAEKIIELLEGHKSYHGLYFYLGAHIATSENPEVCCVLPPAGLLLVLFPAAAAGCSRRLNSLSCMLSPHHHTHPTHHPPHTHTPHPHHHAHHTQVHYKYIEAAAKTGQLKEVERATRESNFYPPDRVKTFLMEVRARV